MHNYKATKKSNNSSSINSFKYAKEHWSVNPDNNAKTKELQQDMNKSDMNQVQLETQNCTSNNISSHGCN